VLVYEQLGLQFQEEATIDAKIVSEAGQPMASFYVLPLRKKDGSFERLLSFSYRFVSLTTYQTKDYVANSILGSTSGKWYRIAVSKDGIYKIDKTFLEACGVNTSNLNPAHISYFWKWRGCHSGSKFEPYYR